MREFPGGAGNFHFDRIKHGGGEYRSRKPEARRENGGIFSHRLTQIDTDSERQGAMSPSRRGSPGQQALPYYGINHRIVTEPGAGVEFGASLLAR